MHSDISTFFGQSRSISLSTGEYTEVRDALMDFVARNPTPAARSAALQAPQFVAPTLSMPMFFGTWSGASLFRVLRPFAMKEESCV